MTNRTLNLNINGNGIAQTSQEIGQSINSNGINTLGLTDKALLSDHVMLNSEDFVVIALNGKSPLWNANSKPVPENNVKMTLFKKNDEVGEEETNAFASLIFSLLMPAGSILSHMNHIREAVDAVQDGMGTKIDIQLTNKMNIKQNVEEEVPLWKKRKLEKEAKKEVKVVKRGLNGF